jgi:diguanylate cyclase (GGDEF)-like protein
MHDRPTLRIYCAAVFVAACGLIALLFPYAHFDYITRQPVTFAVLTAAVILGEMLPVKIPRRGNEEQITLSTSFAMALLLAGGLGPAVIAQGLATVIQDLSCGKPWWRVRFNVGQYTVSMVAAFAVISVLSVAPQIGYGHPLSSSELPAMLLGASAFFLVNTGLVGIAVALYTETPIGRYLSNDPGFVLITGITMLLLAPIVLAAAAFSVILVPLCLAPVVAIYNAMWKGARSEHAARHDSLTGLPNRTAFHDSVKDAIHDRRRCAAVLLIDLDRFKDVNDTLGHRYGDLLLEQVAERFSTQIGPSDRIARLGGDEFAILSANCDRDQALILAQRIADGLAPRFELDQMVVDVQASIGIALFPEQGTSVESMLQKADVAMYRAKETRAGVALYDERHDHHSPAKLALTAELRTAIHGEGISVWYQPVLDLRSGTVPSVEALVRWEHPHLGLLRPTSFVRMAERTNLIRPLTDRVIGLALRQISEWRRLGIEVAVAVNISAQVLVGQDFAQRVVTALNSSGVEPQALKLEVTESALMADPVVAREVLRELSDFGVAISIDDFGTGYSSLAYLADLPVSEVKIDKSFVGRMAEGSSETIIVNSTIDLAHHLDLQTIAEGVEDPAMLPQLEALGCDAAQGYAISRPLAGEDATRWLIDAKRPELSPAPGAGAGESADPPRLEIVDDESPERVRDMPRQVA